MNYTFVYRLTAVLSLLGLLVGAYPSVVWADKVPPPKRVEKRKPAPAAKTTKNVASASKNNDAEQGVPVDLSKRKISDKWDQPYLLAAFGLSWLILLVYLVSLASRLSSTENRLRAMEQQLQDQLPSDD